MPTPAEVLADSKFQGLPVQDRITVLSKIDPNFGGLSPSDQMTVVNRRSGPQSPIAPPPIALPPNMITGANLPGLQPGVFEREHSTLSNMFMHGWELGPNPLDVPMGPILSNALRTAGKVATDLPLALQAGKTAVKGGTGYVLSHLFGAPPWVSDMVGAGPVVKDLPKLRGLAESALERARATNPIDPIWGRTKPPAWEGIQPTSPVVPEASPIPGNLPSGRVPGGIQNQVQGMDTTTGQVLSPLPNGEFRSPAATTSTNPIQPIATSPRAAAAGNKLEEMATAKNLAVAQRLKSMNLDPSNLSDSELNSHLTALGKRALGKGGPLGRDAATTRADIIAAFKGLK